jgi:hypothetical protein
VRIVLGYAYLANGYGQAAVDTVARSWPATRARGPGACFKVPPARTVRRGWEPNPLGEICPAVLTTVPVVFLIGGIRVTPPPTAWPVAPHSGAPGRAGALPAVVGSPYVGVHEAPARSCGGFVPALRDHRSVRRGHRRGRMRLLLGLLVPPPRPQHLPLGVPLRASVSIGGRVREVLAARANGGHQVMDSEWSAQPGSP